MKKRKAKQKAKRKAKAKRRQAKRASAPQAEERTNTFAIARIGSVDVHRPKEEHELKFKADVLAHLRTRQWPEELASPDSVNEGVQFLFAFCEAALDDSLPRIASRHFAEFLLTQHASWEAIRRAYASNALAPSEAAFWNTRGVVAKRAIQFLLERITVLQPGEAPQAPEEHLIWLTDCSTIASEIMVESASQSALAHAVFPDRVILRIRPDRADEYFAFQLTDTLRARMDTWISRRATPAAPAYQHLITLDTAGITASLDPAFNREHGMTLGQILQAARMAHECSEKAPGKGFDVRFVLRESVAEATALNMGTTRDVLDPVFSAFVLSQEAAVERKLWQPKQEPRVLRRPFLSMPHALGAHLAWEESLVASALVFRLQDLAFGRCPHEWETVPLRRAIDAFAQKLDRDWESTVCAELAQRGFEVAQNLKKVGATRLDADGGPGEIDALLVDPTDHSLVVVEIKRSQPTYDPTYWRAELHEYVWKTKNYVVKHQRKVSWIEQHWREACEELHVRGKLNHIPTQAPRVRHVMITKYPSIAAVACDSWPILALAWLVEDFDATGKWPF